MLTRVITDAIVAGLAARSAVVKEETKSDAPAEVAAGEPMADWEKEIANSTEPAIVAEPVASEAVSEVSETMSEPSENLDVAPVPAQEATTDVVSEPAAEATLAPVEGE